MKIHEKYLTEATGDFLPEREYKIYMKWFDQLDDILEKMDKSMKRNKINERFGTTYLNRLTRIAKELQDVHIELAHEVKYED